MTHSEKMGFLIQRLVVRMALLTFVISYKYLFLIFFLPVLKHCVACVCELKLLFSVVHGRRYLIGLLLHVLESQLFSLKVFSFFCCRVVILCVGILISKV